MLFLSAFPRSRRGTALFQIPYIPQGCSRPRALRIAHQADISYQITTISPGAFGRSCWLALEIISIYLHFIFTPSVPIACAALLHFPGLVYHWRSTDESTVPSIDLSNTMAARELWLELITLMAKPWRNHSLYSFGRPSTKLRWLFLPTSMSAQKRITWHYGSQIV